MALYNFHRVLISSTILFAFGFALYSYRLFDRSGQSVHLAMTVVAGIVTVVMVAYLIYFNLKLQRHVTDGQYR